MSTLPLTETDWVGPRRVRVRDRMRARVCAWRLDQALAAGARPDASVALSLRAGRLISLCTRRRLAGEIHRVLRDARRRPSLYDRNFAGWQQTIAPATALLGHLADHLAGPGPVDAAGVALVRVLLRDGSGPLYDPPDSRTLASVLQAAIARLDPGM